MAVGYKLTKINDNITGSDKLRYAVTTVSYGNLTLDQLADQMSTASTFTPGDIKGIIENLTRMIADRLKEGYTVTIDGIGTFSVTGQLSKEVTDPTKVRAESVLMKGVGFKPSPKLKERLIDTVFTKVK